MTRRASMFMAGLCGRTHDARKLNLYLAQLLAEIIAVDGRAMGAVN